MSEFSDSLLVLSFLTVTRSFGFNHRVMPQGTAPAYARTVAVNTLVMFQNLYLVNARYILGSVWLLGGRFGNGRVLAACASVRVRQALFSCAARTQFLFAIDDLADLH